MKLLVFFLLLTNFCFAQKTICVTSAKGLRLSDVSVFQLSEKNTLVGVTDSLGNVKIALTENGRYLFHLLGYTDRTFSSQDLEISSIVKLDSAIYQLNEVGIGKLKLKPFKIVNKPGNWRLGEANTVKTTFERVTAISIVHAGFLHKFSLYADQPASGAVRVFRFIFLDSDHAKPGNSLINYSIVGTLKKGKMIFNLESLGTFIEKGEYYIGYETQNNGRAEDKLKKDNAKIGAWLKSPVVFIKGKSVSLPKAFTRSNLKNWLPIGEKHIGSSQQGEKKYIDFAYELEMRIPVSN